MTGPVLAEEILMKRLRMAWRRDSDWEVILQARRTREVVAWAQVASEDVMSERKLARLVRDKKIV